MDETVNQAAIRETWEETGLLIEPGEIIGLYTRLEAAVVTIAFEARIVGGTAAPTREATEIKAFAPEDIPWSGIAFSTTTWALRDWLDRRRPDLRWPDGRQRRLTRSGQVRSMKTFFVSVYRSSAPIPSSRPMPDIL